MSPWHSSWASRLGAIIHIQRDPLPESSGNGAASSELPNLKTVSGKSGSPLDALDEIRPMLTASSRILRPTIVGHVLDAPRSVQQAIMRRVAQVEDGDDRCSRGRGRLVYSQLQGCARCRHVRIVGLGESEPAMPLSMIGKRVTLNMIIAPSQRGP